VQTLHHGYTGGCSWNCAEADLDNRIGGRVRCMR
jgi:hypothetical protein